MPMLICIFLLKSGTDETSRLPFPLHPMSFLFLAKSYSPKEVTFAMSADHVANTKAVTILNLKVELYVVNTGDHSETHSEISQCCYTEYQYSWRAARPAKLVDQR